MRPPTFPRPTASLFPPIFPRPTASPRPKTSRRPPTPLRPLTVLAACVLLTAVTSPAGAASGRAGGVDSRPVPPGYALPGPFVPAGPAVPAHHETPAPGHGALDPVVRLSAQRLLVADEVAAAKRLSGAPVDDPARNRAVRDAAAAEARALGADPAAAARLLGDQIAAASLVERALLAGWAAGPADAPAVAPPLATLRATLDGFDTRLVSAWNDSAAARTAPGCPAALAGEVASVARELGLDGVHGAALATATAHVCP